MPIKRVMPLAILLLLGASAMAQTPLSTACDLSRAPQAPAAQPPTPPSGDGSASGTDPGSAGSTGWTGGLGGSNIGTTPSGPVPSSPNQHPEAATGLNPIDGPQARSGAASPQSGC